MKKLLLVLLCVYTFANSAVNCDVASNGLSVSIKNDTKTSWILGGVRFQNGGYTWSGAEGLSESYFKIKNQQVLNRYYLDLYFKDGAPIFNSSKLTPKKTRSFIHPWTSGVTGAEPIVDEVYTLIKTASSGIPDIPTSEKQLSLIQIDSVIQTTGYYDSNHRYIDSLGGNGGPHSGGFLDTWKGETQLLFPYHGKDIIVNSDSTTFKTDSTNLMYWITLALGQEYYNVDMQYMAAMGMKESFAGTQQFVAYDLGSLYGPFHMESATGTDRAMAFPGLFPEYQEIFESAADLTSSGIDLNEFMTNYHNGAVNLDDGTVINSYIIALTPHYYIYNVFSHAKDICWKEVLDGAADNRFGVSAIIASYRLGMWSQVGQVAGITGKDSWETTNLDENASALVPVGNNNYRVELFNIVDTMISASKKASSDPSVNLWDPNVAWDDIELLFLGENGTVANQGSGGLLKHLTLVDTAIRNDIMITLESAFNKLKGKAPSTIGTDNISFRYDLLTLLRSVKKYFKPDVFYKRITSGDASILIPQHSNIGGCNSFEIDSLYPYAFLTSSEITDNITFNLNVRDDNSIKDVKWTTDSSWTYWNDAEYISGSGGDQNYKIVAPNTFSRNNDERYEVSYVWYMVTDGAGNSTVKKEKFIQDVNVVKLNKSDHKLNVKLKRDQINLKFDKKLSYSNISIKIVGLNGRSIKTINSAVPLNGKCSVEIDNLTSGMYLLQVNIDGHLLSKKINVLK